MVQDTCPVGMTALQGWPGIGHGKRMQSNLLMLSMPSLAPNYHAKIGPYLMIAMMSRQLCSQLPFDLLQLLAAVNSFLLGCLQLLLQFQPYSQLLSFLAVATSIGLSDPGA